MPRVKGIDGGPAITNTCRGEGVYEPCPPPAIGESRSLPRAVGILNDP